ncbi:MAG TPA: glycosyl hydrolase family 2 [Acidobacteriaceae bacterium]|nr:glycosyl hydrolase family 2 [Acidobacteriaceae bacterium]
MIRNFFASLVGSMLLIPPLSAATITPLHTGWRLQSACTATAAGDAISAPGFSTEGWIATTVPTTVLAAQVAAGLLPNPYFGDNLRKLPGTTYPIGKNFSNLPMAADSPYHCGWWYRDAFTLPPAAAKESQFWLHFGGINYRADVWLNGHRIADSSQIAGAYRIYNLDVTAFLKPGGQNVLAVETFAPTEHDLGINWVDWNPAPPDKDMGLIGEVNLVATGAVSLRSPAAVTHFPNGDLTTADLTLYAEVENGTDSPVQGVVSGSAAGVTFEQPVQLAAHEQRTVVFTTDKYPQLRIHNPKLWWPWQMGDPHLEPLTMRFSVQNKVSDEKTVLFGIREITSVLTGTGSRLFRVNGKPILIRGGGWSQDMMLRTDPKRLREQFRLVRDLNLNTIRLEGKLDTDDFFNLADQNGILVMAGWCCCDQWEHWKDWSPENYSVSAASLHAQMLRLRYHPSLLVWLNGSDNPPPANVESAYLEIEAQAHWPNPILSSATERPTTVTGESGVKMTGPYDYVEPSYWYVDHTHGGAWGYNTETSPGPAIPSLASRAKFLTDPDAWPPTADWSLHNGGGGFTTLKDLDEAMDAIYAKPTSAAEYTRIANTMEYDSERAMFESYSRNKYQSTGVIQWMLNNAWPSMIWHLYDYNLEGDAGYYAVKNACAPLHIQYSYDDQSIVVVNSTYHRAEGLHATVDVRGIHWNELYHTTMKVDAPSDSSQQIVRLPDTLYNGTDRIFLVDLTLADSAGHIVSRNFYWVPYTLTTFDWGATDYTYTPAERYPDLAALTQLPQATVGSSAEIRTTPQGREIVLHLDNHSSALAFQVEAAVRTSSGGLVAPVMWSDNWIELVPGESRTLTAPLPDDAPANPIVKVRGWNIESTTLTPSAAAQP